MKEQLKEYVTERIMDKQSPLYYGDIVKIIEDFEPKKGIDIDINTIT